MDEDKIPPDEFDDAPITKEIPFESMRALVFGVGYNQQQREAA